MNDVLEFTNVSRPGMSSNQSLQCFRADVNVSQSETLRIDAEEMLHQQGDIAQALAQGGEVQAGDIQPIVQIFPEPTAVTSFSSCTLVAATTRTSISIGLREPTRTTCRSCNTRSNLTWRASGRSGISSKKRVPPFAASNQPGFDEIAPVKAPRSWPNSSLSTRVSENAPQFKATNGP